MRSANDLENCFTPMWSVNNPQDSFTLLWSISHADGCFTYTHVVSQRPPRRFLHPSGQSTTSKTFTPMWSASDPQDRFAPHGHSRAASLRNLPNLPVLGSQRPRHGPTSVGHSAYSSSCYRGPRGQTPLLLITCTGHRVPSQMQVQEEVGEVGRAGGVGWG